MADWQLTHGRARGAYQVVAGVQLYVRQVLAADGLPTGSWVLFVDGRREGVADREATAKAAAELAARAAVIGTDAASVAAAAGNGNCAA